MPDAKNRNYEKFLQLRPVNVQRVFKESGMGLVSGRDIYAVMKKKHAICMAANIRNFLSALGIFRAAKKTDAVVLLELAKSETGYCGVHYDNLPSQAEKYSKELGHGIVFGLHMDHYGIKNVEDRDEAIGTIKSAIDMGWTSVSVDGSHCPDYENLINTRDVAMNIPAYVGLEVEVGEIKGKGVLSTVEEAEYFVGGLNSWGVFPDYLAISNGSQHGNYDKASGEEEGIDLNRTKDIADQVIKYGAAIAQHGISGTPLDKVGQFKNYGIHKGNVGTLWQNIVYGMKMDPVSGNALIENNSYVKDPQRGISLELWEKMTAFADKKGYSRKSGDYKKLNAAFDREILGLEKKYIDRILDETEEWASKFFKAFNCAGAGSMVVEEVLKRGDHNSAPEVKIIADRKNYTADKAPDSKKKGPDGKDYSD